METYGASGQTSVVTCPRAMVGRVIGRQGETIKALQVRSRRYHCFRARVSYGNAKSH